MNPRRMESRDHDTLIFIRNTKREELVHFCAMEQGDARSFIIPYSLARHEAEFAKQGIIYKSIWFDDRLIGFLILSLDSDGRSVEFRRIVVTEPGRGYGKRVVRMVDEICRQEFNRARVWLDVFETNARARHVYEQSEWCEKEHAGFVVAGELEIDFSGRVVSHRIGALDSHRGNPRPQGTGSHLPCSPFSRGGGCRVKMASLQNPRR
jgi:diamine N-acetyltransferase